MANHYTHDWWGEEVLMYDFSMFLKGAEIQRMNYPAWKAVLYPTEGQREPTVESTTAEELDPTLMDFPMSDDPWNDFFGSWNGQDTFGGGPFGVGI